MDFETEPGKLKQLETEVRLLGCTLGAYALSTGYWAVEYMGQSANPSLRVAIASGVGMAASAFFQESKKQDLDALRDENIGSS